jgi:peptidase C13-like protein
MADGDAIPPVAVLAQLQQLAPQRPGIIDVYAVIIGGDGREDVFEREVVAVRKRLEERLKVSGRIVTLVNNRRRPQPEATLNSIRFVVEHIAQRMDKEQDLLFVHVTSHGSIDHQLALSHPSRVLRWLDKKHLADILKSSGIRHRFIVLSACYAGGFAPTLANENTVVVAAAASTVMSYGCGCDNTSDMTDFSRAFYTKAMTESRLLLDATRMVAQYVHEEESRLGRDHSYPQASIGPGMVPYLRRLETGLKSKVVAN